MRSLPMVAVAAAVLMLDQSTKFLVLKYVPVHSEKVVTSFLSITHARNTGAAFGMFQDFNIFFIFMTLVILSLLTYYHRRLVDFGRYGWAAMALVWGGALGNLLDRCWHGSVVDFLDFHWRGWHWWTFNVADSAISVGIFSLALASFRSHKIGSDSSTKA